jgi:hypothetical protein
VFTDPQSITINSIAKSLPRTGAGLDTGTFTKDDGEVKMSISHAYNKRNRRTLRVDHQKLAADVMDSSLQVPYSMSVYIVTDTPKAGYTLAEQKQVVDALVAYLTASSGARVTQLLGGEA